MNAAVKGSAAAASGAETVTGGRAKRASLNRNAPTATVAATCRPNEEDTSAASDTEADDKEDENVTEGASLYAHTYAILKGEVIMSQLLEPEILHFPIEFRSFFHLLFGAYVDVPMPNAEGHMTLTAFLHFCGDFGLFPSQVDFQTVQWLYNTAEGCTNSRGRRLS